MNIEIRPPGDHHWVLENNGQLGVIIWTCECGIRTTQVISSNKWMWVASRIRIAQLNCFKQMRFDRLPKSCAEHKMMEALE